MRPADRMPTLHGVYLYTSPAVAVNFDWVHLQSVRLSGLDPGAWVRRPSKAGFGFGPCQYAQSQPQMSPCAALTASAFVRQRNLHAPGPSRPH